MDQIEKISNEIANYILSEKLLDKQQLAKKIEVQIKAAMDHHNFAGGSGFRKQIEKNERLIISIDKEKFEAKYWRSALRNILTEPEMEYHYKTLNDSYKKLISENGS